jgi:hypothetical protein
MLDAGWSGNTNQHKTNNDDAPVETTQVKVEAPSFYDNRHITVDVRPTHRSPLPPGNIPGSHFCYRLSRLQDLSAAEGLY